jgi:uncharacterized protein with NRDE domain
MAVRSSFLLFGAPRRPKNKISKIHPCHLYETRRPFCKQAFVRPLSAGHKETGQGGRKKARYGMCTLVILRRPGDDWPLLIATNRDEMLDREWSAPARHWPDRPEITAGRDNLAGGSWLGLNDHGVIAGILNRMGSLGPSDGKRSRGELVLEALDHADAAAAAQALAELDGAAYRPFNLILADNSEAFWLRHDGSGPIRRRAIPPGLSMFTAGDRNDPQSARVRIHLPRFESAAIPAPESADWAEWEQLLASKLYDENSAGGDGAMCVATNFGFGTVNASLLALPSLSGPARRPLWRFSPGPPNENSFSIINI